MTCFKINFFCYKIFHWLNLSFDRINEKKVRDLKKIFLSKLIINLIIFTPKVA